VRSCSRSPEPALAVLPAIGVYAVVFGVVRVALAFLSFVGSRIRGSVDGATYEGATASRAFSRCATARPIAAGSGIIWAT